jgi:5S rRNA maturation endonuclease (ribonuclease M5)
MTLARAKQLYGFLIAKDRISEEEQVDPDSLAGIRERANAAGWRNQIYLSSGSAPIASAPPPAPPPPMDESFLDDFFIDPIGDGEKYLRKRKYKPSTIVAWELKWHPKQRRIAIPSRDERGRLVGISGRTVDPKGRPKYLHSTGFKRDFYLFGEWKLLPGTGILVEGQLDVIGLWQDGFINGVAAFGSSLTSLQIDKIVRFFSDVVILTDGDQPGREAAQKWEKQLASHMPVRVPEMPKDKDPDDLTKEEKVEILGEPRVVDNRFSLSYRETHQ